jgi:hypothetical protein
MRHSESTKYGSLDGMKGEKNGEILEVWWRNPENPLVDEQFVRL